jgi:ATP-dependent Zn protease
MNERILDEDERVAYHEAGHAIVANHLGYKIGEATIVPDVAGQARAGIDIAPGSRSLHERLLHQMGLHDPKSLEDWLPVLMAGIAAIEIVLGKVELEKWTEALDDINEAHRIALKYGYRDELKRTSVVASAMIRADSILKARRRALDALAKELHRAQTLTGEQVLEIIKPYND